MSNYFKKIKIFTGSGGSGSGGLTDITVVANYSALPNPTTVPNEFYWCEASQGTSWLPGSLGGTYYPEGLYYSNGTIWEYISIPYQATQAEVDAGVVTDKFVTPSTLANSVWLSSEIIYTDSLPITGDTTKTYISPTTGTITIWNGANYVIINFSAKNHSDLILDDGANPHGATTADIADSTDKRYVLDADLVILANTSNTNTGDETTNSIGSLINSAGAATPNDTDLVATAESGGLLKKITWTNVKAFLKTYFDTLYQVAGTYLTSANITQVITNGVTDKAPSEDAVFDALALKKNIATGNAYKFETTDASGNLQETTVTASRAVVTDANGLPTASSVTSTTLAYLDATSSVQTQLDTKMNRAQVMAMVSMRF